jgi:hypothetical protein
VRQGLALPPRGARGRRGKLTAVLLYTLEQGPGEQLILQQCLRERLPLPERIKNAPALLQGLELYYEAFFDLHTCRPPEMDGGEAPIPWLAIDTWASRAGLDALQREDLQFFVRWMDREYLTYAAQKRKEKAPPKTKGNRGGRQRS